MFELFRRNRPVVLDYWYVLLPDFETSTSRFYDEVERALEERKVPNLEVARTLFPEGSVLSARREYLRMRRERLLFEVCSTSFGTSWFFSCRFSEIPLRLRLRHVLVILSVLALGWFAYSEAFGFLMGSGVFAASFLGLVFLLKAVIPLGLFDLDQRLLRMPVLGPVYEIFLRADTYYREDTRIMYCDLVDRVVRAKVEEFAGRQDVKQVEFKRDESVQRGGNDFFAHLWRSLWAGWKKR